jgi:hypothetical protein
MAALDKPADEITHDDYLEIFTDLDLKPRILYPIEGSKTDQPLRLCHPPAVTAVFQQPEAPGAGVEGRPGTGDEHGRKGGRLHAALRVYQGHRDSLAGGRRGRGLADRRGWYTPGNHVPHAGVHLPPSARGSGDREKARRPDHGTRCVHQSRRRCGYYRRQARAASDHHRQQLQRLRRPVGSARCGATPRPAQTRARQARARARPWSWALPAPSAPPAPGCWRAPPGAASGVAGGRQAAGAEKVDPRGITGRQAGAVLLRRQRRASAKWI